MSTSMFLLKFMNRCSPTPVSSAKLCSILCSICKLFRNQTQSVIEKHNRPLIGACMYMQRRAYISFDEILDKEQFLNQG